MSLDANRQERLGRARELRQRGEAARRKDGASAQKCYEEAVALYREGGEPLVLEKLLVREIAKWRQVVKKANLKPVS